MSDKEKKIEAIDPNSEDVLDNVLSNLFNSIDPAMLNNLTNMAKSVVNNTSQSNNGETQNNDEDEDEELDLDLYFNISSMIINITIPITKYKYPSI